MIRLVTDRGDLDLSADTRIEWIVTNPFFEVDDEFVPQLSLPFLLPLTANNQRLMGYAEDLQVCDYDLSIGVNMLVDGILFFRGRLNLLMPRNDGYQCSLGYDRAVIDTRRSIRDFNYGGARSGAGTAANRTAANNLFWPNTDFVWPHVWNVKETGNEEYGGWPILLNNFSAGAYTSEIAVPMPFLIYVMRQIFLEMGGIDVRGIFWESEDIKKKIIYNPVVANTMTGESIRIYASYDSNYHKNNAAGRNFIVGIHEASAMNIQAGATIVQVFEEYPAGAWAPMNTHTLTYTVVAGDVGNSQQLLQNMWTAMSALVPGWVLVGQDWADPDEPYFVVQEGRWFNALSSGVVSDKSFMEYHPFGAFTYNNVLVAKHLPDVSVRDFVNAVKDGFNVTLFYNSVPNTLTFTPRKTQLNTQEYKDYTEKMLLDYEKEVVRTEVTKFVFENDTTDARADAEADWCAKNSPGWDNPNAKEYRIGWGHVKRFANLKNGYLSYLGTGDMAMVNQKLSKYSDEDVPDFSLRLMHWNGMVPDSLSNNYPKGDDYFLTPDQIYTLWFKEWYEATILGREMTKFRLMLTLRDIIDFDPRLKWKMRHNMYVWKEIRMPITMRGVEPSTVIAMRIRANGNVLNTVSGDVVVGE